MTNSSTVAMLRRRSKWRSTLAVALIPVLAAGIWMQLFPKHKGTGLAGPPSPRPSTASPRPASSPAASAPAPKTAPAATSSVDDSGEVLPGHSIHGDTFDEGPRRAARLMGNTGSVHLPITTKFPQAQAFFDQGVGQLHGFWYLEAERSFRQVALIDPSCLMAYWGMTMANYNNVERARGFIQEAVKRKASAATLTTIESEWIDLLAKLYAEPGTPSPQAKRVLIDTMTDMRRRYPKDLELKAFSAFYIWEWKASEQYESVQTMIDEVLAAQPMHPIHHYRIHLLDSKEAAAKALASAALCGLSAPGIAHMWHMPGHPYTKLHRYADATWHQEASARVDHAYMARDGVMPYEIHNYAHNNEWLIRDLLLVGRVRDAINLAKNMIELPRHPKFNESSNRGSGASYGRQRLIDALAQHQMWDELLVLGPTYLQDESDNVDQQIRLLRYTGVAFALKAESEMANDYLSKLQQLKESLFELPTTAPTAGGVGGSASAEEAHPEGPPPQGTTQEKRQQQLVACEQGKAHIYSALAAQRKDFPAAAEQLRAANARNEHLALAYAAAQNFPTALDYAQRAVNDGPGEAYPLAVQILVSQKAGRTYEAKQQFDAFRQIAADVDVSVDPYKSVGGLATAFGVEGEWRTPRAVPPDIAERPALDKLGPFRWRPRLAEDFSAKSASGEQLSLSSYSGKPVIVIFYLGHGCLHCALQLHAFATAADDFASAGISLLAISTDDSQSLSKAWAAAKVDGAAIPFPLASDDKLSIFKQYHCFDDFENTPIHGTFLLDSKGLIRWQDISAEPFMDTQFLLKESQRLLRIEP